MTRDSTHVGALAARLRACGAGLEAVHRQVDELLEILFPGWRPRFPTSMGWRFAPPDKLDVFEVSDSPASVGALYLAGFTTVVLHSHEATKMTTCRCDPRSVIE